MSIRIALYIMVIALLATGCAHSSSARRSPINGWHKKDHKDVPGRYHNNGKKQTPF